MTVAPERRPGYLMLVARSLAIIAARPHLRIIFIAILASGASQGAIIPFLSIWASQAFAITDFEVGLLITVRGIGGLFGTSFFGWLSDRTGRRKPWVILILSVLAVSTALLPLSPTFPIALALGLFNGFSVVGLCFVLVEEVLSRSPDGQGPYRMTISANERLGFNLGAVMGAAGGAFAVGVTGSVPAAFVFGALLAAAGAGAMALLPPLGQAGPVSPAGPGGAAAAGARVPPLAWVALALFLASQLLMFTITWTRNIFLPLYITDELLMPASAVGPVFAVETAVVLLVGPFSGLIIGRVGTRAAMIANLLCYAGGALIVALGSEYWQLFGTALLFGLGQAIGGVASILFATYLLPGRQGLGVSLYGSAFQFAPVFSGLVLGALAGEVGLDGLFRICVGLALVGAVCAGLAATVAARSRATPEPRPGTG